MQIALCKRFQNMASENPNPYRLQFKFWLDITRPDEESIADIIEKLKNARRYTAAVRDGLRLVWDLGQGKTDVLLELFPFVKAALAPSADGSSDSGGVSKADIERLEKLIKEAQHGPLMKEASTTGLQPVGLKTLSGVKPLAAPVYEDDEEMVLSVSKAEGNGDAGMNFLKSMMALQQ
jgi:hypothetical protein